MNRIKIGDYVVCTTYPEKPKGIVIKQYYPTSCPQQTMIQCNDGKIFHAPTEEFVKIR